MIRAAPPRAPGRHEGKQIGPARRPRDRQAAVSAARSGALPGAEARAIPGPHGVRRAVVLSGGGAKGVFESGVLNAFVQVGLEPDVVTGSSVGAVNAVAYAEVLRARREAGDDAAREVLGRALDLWQRLDRERIADLDAWGWRVWVLGVGGPLVGLLIMWLAVSGGAAGLAGLLGRTAAFALGAALALAGVWLLRLWRRLPRRMRERVRRGLAGPPPGPARGEAPPGPGRRHRLLRLVGLTPALFTGDGLRRALARVVPPARRLSEYRACGLDVRLTRTNLRTGRSEVSEHLEPAELHGAGIDRGRRVLGDPRAAAAALASCAFPAAFPPVSAAELYPEVENPQLYARLRARAVAKQELHRVFGPQAKAEYLWFMSWLDELAERDPLLLQSGNEAGLWAELKPHFVGERTAWGRVSGRALFTLVETREWPQLPLAGESEYGDRYFDGGILDNTPLATALDALRDADRQASDAGPHAGAAGPSAHEIFVVLLAPRPRRRYLSARRAARLAGPELGLRALRLQAEQRLADDVKVAEKFDRLLAQSRAARPAAAVAAPAAVAPAGTAPQVVADTPEAGASSPTWAEVFAREGAGAETAAPLLAPSPPPERFVRATVTRIQPTWDLPWVLALDDRLGFERESAREFQARGCRDTLQALHARYAPAAAAEGLPEHARAARRLLGGTWADEVRAGWTCRAERCALRDACDRLAQREAWAADPRTRPAAPGH